MDGVPVVTIWAVPLLLLALGLCAAGVGAQVLDWRDRRRGGAR